MTQENWVSSTTIPSRCRNSSFERGVGTTTITTTANFSKIQEIKILKSNNHVLKVFWLYDSMASQKEYDLPTLASPMKLHENDVSFAERRCVS